MSLNFATPLSFVFLCDKIPLTAKTTQQVTVPTINLGSANIPNPFTNISQPGNIAYGPFSVNFKVLEDYSNYLEIVDWLNELGHPTSLSQFKDKRIDANILPQTSNKKTALRIKIEDIQPSSLSLPTYDITLTGLEYISATVTFDFTGLKFEKVNEIGC